MNIIRLTENIYLFLKRHALQRRTADSKKHHADDDKQQVNSLTAQIALSEDKRATKEGDDNRRATNHRDHSNHRARAFAAIYPAAYAP